MDLLFKFKLCFLVASLLSATTAYGAAIISGTVFCDQCKDGQISFFDFDLPVNGVKVTLACGDGKGGFFNVRDDVTNFLGSFVMKVDGTPDLRGCTAKVSGAAPGSRTNCTVPGSPPRSLKLVFRLLNLEMYSLVGPLVSQPAQPKPFCSRHVPVPGPKPPSPPSLPPIPKLPPLPPLPQLPPLPPLPPTSAASIVSTADANWTNPDYKCYWRAVNPDTKVAVVFGVIAAKRYGTDLTLEKGLQGRGDPYKTLLREAITALLNSYNSLHFPYPPLSVVKHFNWALLSSQRSVLLTALHFKHANSGGYSHVSCKFERCK
uniref:Pollen Ole e 1 allergen and extensin family protein n=1 Tax=Cucumis sativus TaxID=3659 RepID=A0A0A0LJ27_CUCSA